MAPEDDSSTLGVLSAPSELTDFRVREGHLRPPLLDRERPGRARAHDGRFPPLYQLVRSTCALALRRLFGLDVSGLEGLPDKEPFILAANHHNYLDGIVLGVAAPSAFWSCRASSARARSIRPFTEASGRSP